MQFGQLRRREVITVLAGRDIAGAAALVPDEAVEAFGIAGTPQHCATRLRDFIEAGMDEPVLGLLGKNEERKLRSMSCARLARR
jgi:5,10-methylenetetrahydromethanopterin reductase